MPGKFIVIEGGEGAGKSSAAVYLKERLAGENILFTREPGGTPAAEDIRQVVIRKYEKSLDPLTQMLLLTASRREHVTKIVRPALEAGRHVICERFSTSTYAYQVVAGDGTLKDFFAVLDPLSRDNLEPDQWILLHVDVAEGLARKKAASDPDVFEERELAFHKAVRKGMDEYLATRPHVIVDAGKPHQEVYEAVHAAVLKVLH